MARTTAAQEHVTLIKGRHLWRVHWTGGGRDAARRAVSELAHDPANGLDAFDAALLLRGLDRFLIGEFEEFPCPEARA